MAHAPAKPLIAIVGATGTGKSDLAVEIARKFNGEIINGDAMQLYHGLPIITNKITQEEMRGVRHHLLGCIGLEEETFTAGKFANRALSTIDDIHNRGKLPILVGGTHFYTQSLLFRDVLADEPTPESEENRERHPILEEPTDVIMTKLKEVDPIMADRWHPNDRRKIQRSLEIYLKTGKRASQIYNEQRLNREQSPGTAGNALGNSCEGMRFPTLVLWVHVNKEVLYPRLNGRVNKMIDSGLLSEVEELAQFRENYEARTGITVDQSRGIWVSIGYKEFLEYQHALSQKKQTLSEIEQLKAAAIEKTQATTRQYANRQTRWIRIKLLTAFISAGQQNNVFLLDGSDLSRWEDEVTGPAVRVTECFLSGYELPIASSLSLAATELLTPKRDYDLGQRPDLWQKKVCEICGIVAVTENNWSLHVKSRAHRRAAGLEKKREHIHNAPEKYRNKVQADIVDILETYMQSFPDDKNSE